MAEFAEYTKPQIRQTTRWLIATLSQNLTANLYSPMIRLEISQILMAGQLLFLVYNFNPV